MKLTGHHPFDFFVDIGDVLFVCMRQCLPGGIVHEVVVQLQAERERLVRVKSSTSTDVLSPWDDATDDLADFLQLMEVPQRMKRIGVEM